VGTWSIIRKSRPVIQPGPVRIIISPAITIDPKNRGDGEETLETIRNTICENFENCQARE
jgi:hypothetical protein